MAFGHHRTLLGRHRSCHDGPNRLKASVCLERGIGRVSMSACQGCSCHSLMLKKVAVEEELHFGKHLKGVRASAYTSLDLFLCSQINTEHISDETLHIDRHCIVRKVRCELAQKLVMALRQLFPPLLSSLAASPATISPSRTKAGPLLGHLLRPILQLPSTISTVTRFDVPSILGALWDSILRAVPKKKT